MPKVERNCISSPAIFPSSKSSCQLSGVSPLVYTDRLKAPHTGPGTELYRCSQQYTHHASRPADLDYPCSNSVRYPLMLNPSFDHLLCVGLGPLAMIERWFGQVGMMGRGKGDELCRAG